MLTEHIVAPPMMLALNMALVTSSTVLPSLRQKATPAADMTPPILLRPVRIWTRSNSPFQVPAMRKPPPIKLPSLLFPSLFFPSFPPLLSLRLHRLKPLTPRIPFLGNFLSILIHCLWGGNQKDGGMCFITWRLGACGRAA